MNAFGLVCSNRLMQSRVSLANHERGRVIRARNIRRLTRQQAAFVFFEENVELENIDEIRANLRPLQVSHSAQSLSGQYYRDSLRDWVSSPYAVQFGFRHRRNFH